jgi:hypothetical protein
VHVYLAIFGGAAVALVGVWLVPKWQIAKTFLPDKERLTLENELRKTVAQFIGGAAILVSLYFAWQQLQQSRRSLDIAQEGQTTERFTRAVDQVGSQQLQVRVGGIYALSEISKDRSYDRHWVVLSVLTAFLRDKTSWQAKSPRASLPEDIQAALSVIGSRDPGQATYDTN